MNEFHLSLSSFQRFSFQRAFNERWMGSNQQNLYLKLKNGKTQHTKFYWKLICWVSWKRKKEILLIVFLICVSLCTILEKKLFCLFISIEIYFFFVSAVFFPDMYFICHQINKNRMKNKEEKKVERFFLSVCVGVSEVWGIFNRLRKVHFYNFWLN